MYTVLHFSFIHLAIDPAAPFVSVHYVPQPVHCVGGPRCTEPDPCDGHFLQLQIIITMNNLVPELFWIDFYLYIFRIDS